MAAQNPSTQKSAGVTMRRCGRIAIDIAAIGIPAIVRMSTIGTSARAGMISEGRT